MYCPAWVQMVLMNACSGTFSDGWVGSFESKVRLPLRRCGGALSNAAKLSVSGCELPGAIVSIAGGEGRPKPTSVPGLKAKPDRSHSTVPVFDSVIGCVEVVVSATLPKSYGF